MSDVYAPCLCGSGKKFKFCCCEILKEGDIIPPNEACCKFPIYECKILENWEDVGVSPVYIVRELEEETYVLMSYLIDFWCLGLKSTLIKFGISKSNLQQIYSLGEKSLQTISYQDARSAILGAIDFAKAIDLAPCKSWNGIASSFIEAHLPYKKKFSFGCDGKPCYISGPKDSELYDIKEVVDKVAKADGHYTIQL